MKKMILALSFATLLTVGFSQPGTALADKMDGKSFTPQISVQDKMDGKSLTPSDKMDGKSFTPSDKMDGK